MPIAPDCAGLGRRCRELSVTLRIADDSDSPSLRDAAATWLTGHTERMTVSRPYVKGSDLLADTTIHVPCRYLRTADGTLVSAAWTNGGRRRAPGPATAGVRCAAHGFAGPLPPDTRPLPADRLELRRGSGRFRVVFRGRQRMLRLPLKRAARRSLPVAEGANPCLGAPCRTADNRVGAACCRDLSLDVVAPEEDRFLEALLHSRQSPYLCKVTREGPAAMECEVISACAFLEEDGVHCSLHDRVLPNGRIAKPSICSEWPDLGPDDEGHPGCRLL
jgi:hypothetical protein